METGWVCLVLSSDGSSLGAEWANTVSSMALWHDMKFLVCPSLEVMSLTRIAERKLDAAPTDIHLTESKIYLSTKRNNIVETGYDASKFRRIPIDQSIRDMVGSEDCLVCFPANGVPYSVGMEDGTVRKMSRFGTRTITAAVCGGAGGSVILGTGKGSVLVCDDGLETHRTLYGQACGVVGLALSGLNAVACVHEVSPVVTVFELKSSRSRSVRIPRGFAQAVVFVSSTQIAVGSQGGDMYLIDVSSGDVLCSLAMADPVSCLVWNSDCLLIGTEGGKVHVVSVVDNRMEVVDSHQFNGIVNVIRSNRGYVVVGVGKEPRHGRWSVRKDGEHRLVILGTK